MDAAATLNIDYQRIRQYYTSFHPQWMLKQILPDTEMLSCRYSANNDVNNAAFRELVDHEYRFYQHIYTDGSKNDGKTGYAVITPNRTLKVRLANEASFYTAELSDISQALFLLKRKLKSDG
jgi:hypothetical protein